MALFRRLRSLGRRASLEHEIDAELREHMAMCIDDSMAEGMSREEAERDARKRFGSPTAMRERVAAEDAALGIESLWQDLRGAPGRSYLKLVLAPAERALLDAGLARRFEAMLEAGLVAEVQALYRRGDLDPDLPALRAVGYRQLWAHVAGQCDLASARVAAIRATRQLAKRQYTWLRAEPAAHWVGGGADPAVAQLARHIEAWVPTVSKATGSLC